MKICPLIPQKKNEKENNNNKVTTIINIIKKTNTKLRVSA